MHIKVLSNIRNLHDSEFHCNVLQGNCPYCSAIDTMYVFKGNLQQHWAYCVCCETGVIPKEKLVNPVDNLPIKAYKTTRYFIKSLLLNPDMLNEYIPSAHAVFYRLGIAPNIMSCPIYNYVYKHSMGMYPYDDLGKILRENKFTDTDTGLQGTKTPVAVFPMGALPGKVEGLFLVGDETCATVRYKNVSKEDLKPLIYLRFTGAAGTCFCDSITEGSDYIISNLDRDDNVICAPKI